MVLHPNPTHKWVKTHSAHFLCLDKPRANLDSLDSPRLGLRGSHHLPPYSILCNSPWGLHPNGSFPWDSQSEVPKLSRFGLPGLWTLITPRPELGSGWGLNQSCSSPWELFNDVSHFTCTHRNRVDSWLLVVGSQTASLTPGPSFDHNLCCRCPNGSCEAILDIYNSRPFQRCKERLNASTPQCVLNPTIALWVFGSLRGLPSPIFGSVSGDLTTPSKWGYDIYSPMAIIEAINEVKGVDVNFINHHDVRCLCYVGWGPIFNKHFKSLPVWYTFNYFFEFSEGHVNMQSMCSMPNSEAINIPLVNATTWSVNHFYLIYSMLALSQSNRQRSYPSVCWLHPCYHSLKRS
jgi:hypothetical protein